MLPIFIAHGPAFKKNFKMPSFNNVDIYELMCAVLEIRPAENNGSLANVQPMLLMTRKNIICKGSIKMLKF